MSDLNDLIHTNARIAFNAGYKSGRAEERKAILEVIKSCTAHDTIGEHVYLKDLHEHLEEYDASESN